MSYRVFLHAYTGIPHNHHAIFVELETDGSGCLFHVEGSVQTGMTYNPKPAGAPLKSPSFHARKAIGFVPARLYEYVNSICSSLPPPPKQYNGPKRQFPKSPLRRCQEWTADAVDELKAQDVLQGEEGKWVTRADMENDTKSSNSTSQGSSSQAKSKSSAASHSSSYATSKSSSSTSSTSEPAHGVVSADGFWVYSRKDRAWLLRGQGGIWAKQAKARSK